MDRIKRLSMDILEKNDSVFGVDFDENKKLLNEITIIRSKSLKNQIAGYITSLIKKQMISNDAKQNSQSNEEPAASDESL